MPAPRVPLRCSTGPLATRRALHLFLLGKGVKTVTAEYSGGGDSGAIDEVNFEGGPDHIEDELVEIAENDQVTKANVLGEVVQVMFDALLDTQHPGWENNDGGSGRFEWDIETNELKLEHHEYYTESTLHESEF